MSKVLIFTPTYIDPETGQDAMHPACEASVIVQLRSFEGHADWRVGRENPHPVGDYRNVLHQYQVAQEVFLAGEWDALLTVEHDNELPDDALQRMYGTKADVVYAPYVLRHGMRQLSTWQYINDRNLGMSLTLYPFELAQLKAAGVGRVSGVGHGCTLFRRHTLEALPFRAVGDGTNFCPDIPFAEDALRMGFVSMGRFDAPVAHWEKGVRLEPYQEGGLVLYTATETCNALADGKVIHLEAGQTYELTPIAAADLIRAGYLAQERATVAPSEVRGAPTASRKRAKG